MVTVFGPKSLPPAMSTPHWYILLAASGGASLMSKNRDTAGTPSTLPTKVSMSDGVSGGGAKNSTYATSATAAIASRAKPAWRSRSESLIDGSAIAPCCASFPALAALGACFAPCAVFLFSSFIRMTP